MNPLKFESTYGILQAKLFLQKIINHLFCILHVIILRLAFGVDRRIIFLDSKKHKILPSTVMFLV